MFEESKRKPKYIFCFFSMMVSRLVTVLFSVYLQMWIYSFIDSQVIEDKFEAKRIYTRIVAGSMLGCGVLLPFFGKIVDSC